LGGSATDLFNIAQSDRALQYVRSDFARHGEEDLIKLLGG
jgi:hypothetical protein